MKNLLENRVIGITGAYGYLGLPMVIGMLRAGARVVATGRKPGDLERIKSFASDKNLDRNLLCKELDIGSDDQIERFFTEMPRDVGEFTGWVNNAYAGISEPLGRVSRKGVEATLANGLASVIVVSDKVVSCMLKAGIPGSIVNIGSMYGHQSPYPDVYRGFEAQHNPPAYGAAKAGIAQYTRYAACHLGKYGIRVNTLSPGPFPNPNKNPPDFIKRLGERVPLGRVGTPEDLVGPLIFLLSNMSDYVSGANIAVDGGWTAW
jgi:NAD(P)-dependent dehydrogenase (short-subunit alcohol dehydrogenase family)